MAGWQTVTRADLALAAVLLFIGSTAPARPPPTKGQTVPVTG